MQLGKSYLLGEGVERNIPLSVKWFEKSAAQDNTKALASLGVLYEMGASVKQDKKKAKEYYGLACEKGNQDGCNLYRELNEQGE